MVWLLQADACEAAWHARAGEGVGEGVREGAVEYRIVANDGLVEAAQAQNCVVKAALLQKVLRAGLDLHQGHGRELLTLVDAAENVALDTHCLQAE
jgi:hypothetical protein